MHVTSVKPICAANSRYSRSMSGVGLLGVVDQVHLVDGDDDASNADQRHQIAVAPRLRQHALSAVDQDHRQVGGGGAGHHVARVLLVARRVGHDELALVGGEIPVRDVDRDALLALGRQAVDQQREVELVAARAHLLGVGRQRRELILEDHLGLVQQPADQRRLAVIHAAAGDEAQQALALVRAQVGVDVGVDEVGDVRHQKYPSTFFFSIDADWS